MTTRNKPNTTPDPRKVSDLKDKARREADQSVPSSGGTIHSVLYGSHLENQRAAGAGEFDA
ncbi:hypothetical protein VPHD148_0221 [Vibrio phage D148]